MAFVEGDQRIGVVHFGPAAHTALVGRPVHRTDRLASAVLVILVRDGPEGFGRRERIFEIAGIVGIELAFGRSASEQAVHGLDHLVVLAAVEVNPREQAHGRIVGDISGIAAARLVLEQSGGLYEVVADLIVHDAHGRALGGRRVGRGAQHDAHVVAAEGIGPRVEHREVQVTDGAQEIVLAQHPVALVARPFGLRLDHGVSAVDDMVGAPPEVGSGQIGLQVLCPPARP